MLKQRIVCILMTLVLILCAAPAVFADELSDQQAKVTELQTKVIEQTQTELDAAEARRAGQQTALEQRLRAMYMYGNDGYIEMIFSSKSFDEIITYTDVSADIIEADRKTQTDLTDTKNEIAEKEQKLKDDKAAIEQAQPVGGEGRRVRAGLHRPRQGRFPGTHRGVVGAVAHARVG